MPKHKRGIIPNQYSLVQPTNISSEQSTPAESKETLNILNGVLNCAWNKTSAIPKLLEIANTSEVKFNIDSDNPLVLAFANGWDDLDRPAQIVKRLATAPSNIDLSAKANCHVQICAKVINDELTITTHDIYDPGWETWINIVPSFATGAVDASPFDGTTQWKTTKDGWAVSSNNIRYSNYPKYMFDNNDSTRYEGYIEATPTEIYVEAPFAFSCVKFSGKWAGGNYILSGYDEAAGSYTNLSTTYGLGFGEWGEKILDLPAAASAYKKYRFRQTSPYSANGFYTLKIFERPTAKFFRGLNKAKDRTDTEVYWVNLGYATIDAAGAITALTHYTDLRNNYPGGMRVEA